MTLQNPSDLLINAFDDIFDKEKVMFDHDKNQLIFYRHGQESNDLQRFNQIEREIFERTALIEYLRNNRYIYLVEDSTCVNTINSIGGFEKEGLDPIGMDISKEESDIIYDCINKRVFITQDLIELCENNFKTIEDQTLDESKKQTRIAMFTMFLSIASIVVSTICRCLCCR